MYPIENYRIINNSENLFSSFIVYNNKLVEVPGIEPGSFKCFE